MAFGNNYYHVDALEFETLENGTYRARIVKAELKEYSNHNEFCEIKVEISGHPNCNPNTIILNESPVLGQMKANGQPVEKKDVDAANGRITRFFESFGIADGDFDFMHWKGKIGTVRCAEQYDKNEPDHKSKQYKQLTPIVEKKKNPAPVEAVKKAFNGTEVKSVTSDDGFNEDIPF